jgi:hypothetical protein
MYIFITNRLLRYLTFINGIICVITFTEMKLIRYGRLLCITYLVYIISKLTKTAVLSTSLVTFSFFYFIYEDLDGPAVRALRRAIAEDKQHWSVIGRVTKN